MLTAETRYSVEIFKLNYSTATKYEKFYGRENEITINLVTMTMFFKTADQPFNEPILISLFFHT